MKRVFALAFTLVLVVLFVWLLANRTVFSAAHTTRKTARTIVPSETGTPRGDNPGLTDAASYDESRAQPLIMLENDEVFLQAVAVDLNRDGAIDQVCAVKHMTEPNVFLVPGVQNPITGEYSRLTSLKTGVTQARTLLLYVADVIGDRTNCIVFSGMTADNMQSLAVFQPVPERDGKTSLAVIADLRSDGPINVREVPRSDAYNLGVTGGDSYPIITYNSDPDAPDTLDQIERVYRWDRQLKRYEQTSEARIPGKKLESRIVQQLQGGNVEAFETYLTGLWYIQNTTGTMGPRYIYFDTPMKEIVFHNNITEEVFIREAGSPRRYGAYLTTRNRSISSIRRLIDLELTGIDEIRVRILEDVRLKIGVASDWDGVYRKMSNNAVQQRDATRLDAVKKAIGASEEPWTTTDGRGLTLLSTTYSSGLTGTIETGAYALLTVAGEPVLQFRLAGRDTTNRFFKVAVETEQNSGAEEQKLTLTEVTVSMAGTNLAGSQPIVVSRKLTAAKVTR